MRFTSAFLLACSAALIQAQVFFTMATLPTEIAPGTNYDITWLSGPGSNTYSIFLVQGPSSNLKTIMSIGNQQPHNGTLSWSPSPSLAKGTDYAFKIVNDANANDFNYSAQFGILTSITASNTASIASTSGSLTTTVTSAATSSSAALTTLTGSTATTSRASTATGSSSSTRASTATSSTATPSQTPNVNAARSVKVGGGLLAAVAGVMIAL